MSKFKFSPRHGHVTVVGSRWREPAPLRRQTCVCRLHVPALKYRGNHHLYSSPLRSEHSRSQSDIKTSSSYIFCPAQEAHKHTLTHARTSCAQCAHSRGNLRLVHSADSAYFYFFQTPAAARMPQPAQNSLVHVLLMWTIILTIVQGVFIVLFFTREQPEQVRPLKVLLVLVCLARSRCQSFLSNSKLDRNGSCVWPTLFLGTCVLCICSILWFY